MSYISRIINGYDLGPGARCRATMPREEMEETVESGKPRVVDRGST